MVDLEKILVAQATTRICNTYTVYIGREQPPCKRGPRETQRAQGQAQMAETPWKGTSVKNMQIKVSTMHPFLLRFLAKRTSVVIVARGRVWKRPSRAPFRKATCQHLLE